MEGHIRSSEYITKIEDWLVQADTSESAEQRSAALAFARKLAEECVQAHPEDADCCFITGLAMYNSFAVDETYGDKAEYYLKGSLSLNSEHQFARLYLGHYYYDIKHYGAALLHFEKVADSYFLSANKAWRVLKLHELMLCCKLRLNHSDVDINNFSSLIEEFDHSLPEDIPVPLEMAVTLAETKENIVWQKVNRGKVVKLFVSFVERQDFREVLQDYIAAY